MIQATSREAYQEIKPKINRQQAELLAVLGWEQALTDREMKVALGWEINVLCARRNELVNAGVVVADGCRKCSVTGRNVIQWRRVYPITLF